jgi:PAS domain S-box-containing protein
MKPAAPHPKGEYFARTVAMVREVLEDRLQKVAETPDAHVADMQALRVSLQELEVLWEEMQSQGDRLAAQHQRYVEFFENAPDAYLVTDVFGNIQEANATAAQLLNVRQRSLILKPLQVYLSEEDRRLVPSRLNLPELKASGETKEWEGTVLPTGGEPVQVCFRLRVRAGGDSPIALYWLIRRLA